MGSVVPGSTIWITSSGQGGVRGVRSSTVTVNEQAATPNELLDAQVTTFVPAGKSSPLATGCEPTVQAGIVCGEPPAVTLKNTFCEHPSVVFVIMLPGHSIMGAPNSNAPESAWGPAGRWNP